MPFRVQTRFGSETVVDGTGPGQLAIPGISAYSPVGSLYTA